MMSNDVVSYANRYVYISIPCQHVTYVVSTHDCDEKYAVSIVSNVDKVPQDFVSLNGYHIDECRLQHENCLLETLIFVYKPHDAST